MNILTSFFVQPLFHASTLNLWWKFYFCSPIFLGGDSFTFTKQKLQPLQQQTFKWINQNFHEISHYKNEVHEIMSGWKKKLSYLSESPWFSNYYIGWIVIGNCHHIYYIMPNSSVKDLYELLLLQRFYL